MTNLEINEKELKKHIEEYKVVYYNYLKKRLSLLYDGPCIQIYKDLLHPKHKKDIIKTTVKVIKKINENEENLTNNHFCAFVIDKMLVKVSMQQDNQWSYWNSMKNYLEIQTFVFGGKTFCDIISQDDFLEHLLYEIDFYYSIGE